MKTIFEDILETWINGNKSDVRKAVNKLSYISQHEFKIWLREKRSHEWVDQEALFEMILFICFE